MNPNKVIVIDELHRRAEPQFWIAINQASCARCPVATTKPPKVSPVPQRLVGFATLAEAEAAQRLCVEAPIAEVAKAVQRWEAGAATVIDCKNPEPPQAETVWSIRPMKWWTNPYTSITSVASYRVAT